MAAVGEMVSRGIEMMPMAYAIATREWKGWKQCVFSWDRTATAMYPAWVAMDQDVMPAYQECFERLDEPVIAFLHDDLVIYEQYWDNRVLQEFADPSVGVVGFGGALGHGRPELYTVPYYLPNLARQNFMSNMRDAEKHGTRFRGEREVAICDGFALFVRRTVLERAGGWPVGKPYGYFMYSEWLCCEARRQGSRIRLVGVDCEHLGGKSSGWISPNENYELAHKYFYENNRDVMPYRVP